MLDDLISIGFIAFFSLILVMCIAVMTYSLVDYLQLP